MNFRLTLAAALALVVIGCTRPAPQVKLFEPVRISPDGAAAAEPAIAGFGDGAYVVYVEHNGKDGANVYLQQVDATGKTRGERTRVNTEIGSAKAWNGDPPTVAVGTEGTVYVGWTRRYTDPKAIGNDLVISASRDGGKTFGPAVKVNDDSKPASHGMHSLAVDAKGRVIAAWLDERNVVYGPNTSHAGVEPNSEVFTAVSDDGGKTFSPNLKIAADVCPCCKTSLLAAADGTIYLSWRQVLEGDHRHIAVAASNDAGSSFAPAVIVSNDQWQLSACPVSGAALASVKKGELTVAWYTGGSAGPAGVYSATSRDNGKTFAPRRLIAETTKSGTPSLALNAATFNAGDKSLTHTLVGTERSQTIHEATNPAAAIVQLTTFIAFTRPGDTSSVWLLTIEP